MSVTGTSLLCPPGTKTDSSPLSRTICPPGSPEATTKLWLCLWQAAGGVCWAVEPKPCLSGKHDRFLIVSLGDAVLEKPAALGREGCSLPVCDAPSCSTGRGSAAGGAGRLRVPRGVAASGSHLPMPTHSLRRRWPCPGRWSQGTIGHLASCGLLSVALKAPRGLPQGLLSSLGSPRLPDLPSHLLQGICSSHRRERPSSHLLCPPSVLSSRPSPRALFREAGPLSQGGYLSLPSPHSVRAGLWACLPRGFSLATAGWQGPHLVPPASSAPPAQPGTHRFPG